MNMPGKIVVIGTGDGRYIDVFPESISKGEAAKFVISQVNIDENSRIVSFGDSNNDRELLQVTKEAYFVKNIESDAFKWYTKNKEKQENKHIKISEFEQAAALRYYLQNDL